MQTLTQSTATNIMVFIIDSSDHRSGKTGLDSALTVEACKDGGSFTSISPVVTEKAYGWYQLALTTTHTNTLGPLLFHITGLGADPLDKEYYVSTSNFDSLVDNMWDEILTGATHNIPTSAARRLRQVTSNVILDGLITSATENTVSFDGDASTVNGAYDPAMITITSGNGIGQTRLIYQYEGATKTAVLDRDWKVQPQAGDACLVLSDPGREHVNEGRVRDAGTNWIKLNANASSYDNAYVGQVIFLRSGYGEDQACRVISYDGTTKVAIMAKDWHVIPNTTTAYVMLPTSVLDLINYSDIIATKTWQNSNRTLTYSPLNTASINNTAFTFVRGDTISYVFEDIDFTDFDNAYFTIKKQYKDEDYQSIIQVDEANGLLYLNSVKISTYEGATLTKDEGAGTLTLLIDASISKQIPYSDSVYYYDLQIVAVDGATYTTVTTPYNGEFSITRDVTRKTA